MLILDTDTLFLLGYERVTKRRALVAAFVDNTFFSEVHLEDS
jgi:hypothetical protein